MKLVSVTRAGCPHCMGTGLVTSVADMNADPVRITVRYCDCYHFEVVTSTSPSPPEAP